jgi:hypothetical protein
MGMTGTKSGRERRKAWIYSVINPLLEGLRIEATFLARENWTFRRYSRELEFIRPVPILVGYKSIPNLEDLTTSKPETQKAIERRETQREKLRDACRVAFDTLAADPDFQRKVSDALQAVESERPGEAKALVHPAVPFHEVIAEVVVNKGGVPDHAGIYPFWSQFQGKFLPFRLGSAFDAADQAGRELEKFDNDLAVELIQLRSVLAEDYDIPWAPYDEASTLASR